VSGQVASGSARRSRTRAADEKLMPPKPGCVRARQRTCIGVVRRGRVGLVDASARHHADATNEIRFERNAPVSSNLVHLLHRPDYATVEIGDQAFGFLPSVFGCDTTTTRTMLASREWAFSESARRN
jgi:hypothetical protein